MHGVYDGEVSHDGENLIVDGTKIKVRRQEEKKNCLSKRRAIKAALLMPTKAAARYPALASRPLLSLCLLTPLRGRCCVHAGLMPRLRFHCCNGQSRRPHHLFCNR